MVTVSKIFGLLLLSATKFLFAPGLIRASGFNFWQSIILSTIGGLIGITVFYFLGLWISKKLEIILHLKEKRKFTRLNRFIVRTKHRFGLIGIVAVTPCLISIPIGCIIASKYFKHDPRTLKYLYFSLIIWSLILNSLVYVVQFDFLMKN